MKTQTIGAKFTPMQATKIKERATELKMSISQYFDFLIQIDFNKQNKHFPKTERYFL